LLFAIGFSALYLLQPWLTSRGLGRFDPRLSTVPTSLPNNAEAALSNSSINCYGIKLQLPKEVIRTDEGKYQTMVRFHTGWLTFVNPSNEGHWIVAESVHRDERAERLFNQDELHSNFNLMRAAMSATPGQAKWWKLRSFQNERAEFLLEAKFSALTNSLSLHPFTIFPIYSITSGEFRGFQLGNPNIPPYDTHIDQFDGTDRHLAFDITGFEGHEQVLTQEEINAMVKSIQSTSNN